MKQLFAFLTTCLFLNGIYAQKENFDIVTCSPPKGWKRELKPEALTYYIINQKKKTWCKIAVLKSIPTKGNIEADFNSEWETIAKPLGTGTPQLSDITGSEEWKMKNGAATFNFNNAESVASLTTISGNNVCVSILATTNSQEYISIIQDFLNSVKLAKPATPAQQKTVTTKPDTNNSKKGSFTFTTTNFDDGWKSTVQEDWVEVTKGNVKVLLHYPKDGTVFPADPEPLTNAAWNILVAPRYSNLKNYKTAYINTYNRPYLGMGYATEKSSGKDVFVLLFRQGGGWLEFVTPDKNTFIQQYKFDPETIRWDSESDLLKPLANMSGYNKFAVAAADFKGKWTSDFTGIQQLYNIYTGAYGGMHMNQSNEEFVFGSNNSYNWKLLVVSGMVGNAQFNQVKSSGTFSVPNNWQLQCSKIEKGPKLYNAFWSCIKGARVLNLLDAQYPGSGIYTQYGLAK